MIITGRFMKRRQAWVARSGFTADQVIGLGADTFTDPWAARVLRHPMPLALEFVSLVYHGVLDRYRDLRVGFFEGRLRLGFAPQRSHGPGRQCLYHEYGYMHAA